MSSTRQLAAIMFTDIVGYTALMGDDEDKAFDLLNKNRQLQKPIIEKYGGRWIKELGDGVMASFATATDAVQCAISIQQACNSIPGLQLRIGIHLGDVVFEENDVFGDGVNIASRLQAIATPGSIYISEAVHNNIANKREINTKFVRAETLKHVKGLVRVYEVSSNPADKLHGFNKKTYKPSSNRKKIIFGTIGVLFLLALLTYYFFVYKKAGSDKKLVENSIAVLYFNNMSGDSTQEYFSDGITEEITSRLAKIGGLKVKSRTSVLQYKNQTKTAKLIAQELGVNNILEGSVRKQGSKVVITAQLINGETDEHIWSETYNREMKDIFEVQSDIAQQIASKFQINLSDVAKKSLETAPTLNVEAYDLYLKASSLFYLGDGTGNNNKKSIALLKQAIQLDPAFADAYALLSEAYVYISPLTLNPKQWLDSAAIFGQKAIEINPDRESGYIAMAKIKQWKGLYDEALQWLFKAHEINPFSIIQSISWNYVKQKEYGKAYGWIRKAIAYDPAEPSNYSSEAGIFFKLGLLDSMKSYIDRARRLNKSGDMDWDARNYYLFTGNEEEYIALCKKAFALDEEAFNTQMAIFYVMQKNWRKADSLSPISSRPDNMDGGLAKIHSGKKDQGDSLLKKTIDKRKSFLGFADEWHYFDISRCYAALRDSRYIYYFNKAVERGWHDYTFIEHDPFFDFVRNTPEFKKLRQKVYERNEDYKADLFAAIRRHEKK
jgi:TolB-like protein/class 3 adenylate cyclase